VDDELKHKILVVDDDEKIRELMQKFLSIYNYQVHSARDGKEMHQQLLQNTDFDLICLDVMLPGDDGFKLLRQLRKSSNIPVIMLTAAGEDTDTITGFDLGADDYLKKPFNPHELLVRIKAILRRGKNYDELDCGPCKLVFLNWVLNKTTRQLISPDGVEVAMTDGEYRLLEAFAERPNQILSRDDLLEITQNRQAGPFDRSIDVRISRLRQKIEPDIKHPAVIKTVRGGGYIFATKVEKQS